MLGECIVEEKVCCVDFLFFGAVGDGWVVHAVLEDFVEGSFGAEDVFRPAGEKAGVVGGDELEIG